MSLMITYVAPEFVQVWSDSISYDDDATNIKLTSKVEAFPYARLLVATTGSSALAIALLSTMRFHDLAPDLDALVVNAPPMLRKIWEPMNRDDKYSTVRLLGYSPARGHHTGFLLRSGADFEPVEHEGWAVIPSPVVIPDAPDTEVDVIALAEKIRTEQLAEDGGRVLIGGPLVSTWLRDYEVVQRVIHRFDDSRELWEQYIGHLPDADVGWADRRAPVFASLAEPTLA